MQFKKIIALLLICYSILGYTQKGETRGGTLKQQFLSEKNQENKVKLALQIADSINYSDVNEVVYYANQAYAISKKNQVYNQQVKAIQFLGNAAIIQGDYKKAQYYFTEAKAVFENQLANDHKGLIKTLGSLGVIASEQSNYNKALSYYLEAKKIADSQNLIPMQIILNNNN